MSTILVTGAGGRLGRRLVQTLLSQGQKVLAVTSNPSFDSIAGLKSIQVDWSNFELPKMERVDLVFHLAHQTSAYKAREDVSAEVRQNLLVTAQLVEHLRLGGSIPKFIYLGSLTEYGTEVRSPILESTPLKPETFYDAAKIASEIYLEQFFNEGWIQQLQIFRLGNLYGMGVLNPSEHRGFLDNSIARAAKGLPIQCLGTGEYLRDFIHVEDVLDVFMKTVTEGQNSKIESISANLASGYGTTILDALRTINRALVDLGQENVEIEFSDFPKNSYAIETRSHIADISQISTRFNWSPKISLYEGVSASLKESFDAHPE